MEKEVKKEETKKMSKGNRKYMFVILGVGVVSLSTILVVIFAGIIALKYSSTFRDYIYNTFSSDSTVTQEKKIVITNEESNVIDIVDEVSSSVVSIAISQLTLSQGQGLVDKSSNIGSGFIVDKDGLIVTNQHVVSDTTSEYKVVTNDGEEFDVVEILRDDLNDVALIKIDPKDKDLTTVSLGDSDNMLVGQTVIAIGTPLGEYAGSVTTGIVSGLNRSVTAGTGWFGSTTKTYEDVIQTDAAVNSGNSGGPLLNSQGEVIGINFATTSNADNISFAIPINKIKGRLEEYRTYGKFIRPLLGVSYQMITEYEALYYSDVVPGALIVRVDPTSPAYQAGLQRGDIITQFGDVKVDRSLGDIIQEHEVNQKVKLKIVRNGEEKNIEVTLGEMD